MVQEDQAGTGLLCRHVVVDHTGMRILQGRELVKVSGKDGQAADLDNVFGYRSGKTVSVEGGRSTSEFVNQNEAAGGGPIQDGSRVEHFGHKSRDAPILLIPGPDPCQNCIDEINCGRGARNERPHLCERHNGTQSSQVGGFATLSRQTEDKVEIL